MIEKGVKPNTVSVLNKKTSKNEHDQMNIFNQINLNYLFTNEEIEKLMTEPIFGSKTVKVEEREEEGKSQTLSDEDKAKNKNKYSFDRMTLILKFLQISIEKLDIHKENTIAKGLEW
jgi:hypothetical protein